MFASNDAKMKKKIKLCMCVCEQYVMSGDILQIITLTGL